MTLGEFLIVIYVSIALTTGTALVEWLSYS